MTPKEALEKIKAMFAEMPQEQPAAEIKQPITLAEYVLASGAKVMIDKLEIGGKVVLVDEAGNESPAPAGEHQLADGTQITVDENGMIVEVSAPVEETPEVEDLAAQKIAELEAQIAELKKSSKAAEVKMAEDAQKFSQAIKEISDVVLELINTPSAQATEKPKDAFVKHVPSKETRIATFLNKYAR